MDNVKNPLLVLLTNVCYIVTHNLIPHEGNKMFYRELLLYLTVYILHHHLKKV